MITCKIFTLGKMDSYNNVQSASFDWGNQELEILPGHAELFAAIPTGKLSLKTSGEPREVELNNALINFENSTNSLIILQ